MKFILYADSFPLWEEKLIELVKEFPKAKFIRREKSNKHDLKEAHALIGGEIPVEDIERAVQLKMIFVNFTGPNRLPFQ